MSDTLSKLSREQEKILIGRAQGGDRASMRQLVDWHKDRLFAFIWRMMRDHHEAEDVCQEAFLKAFGSLDTFSSEYRFSTWLFTIGYRVCLNRLRRRRMFAADMDLTTVSSGAGSVDNDVVESDEAGRIRTTIWSAVDKLSAPQRAATLLFYRNELGCHEIARVLQLPVATVKSHLHRARVKLKELLESAPEHEWRSLRNYSQRTG